MIRSFNLDLCVDYEQEIIDAIHRVIARKQYILGMEGASFEGEWAAYNAAPFAVGVGNGTDAIRIALLALGVKPGDEVISPAFNVAYTAQAVHAIGARNVFVDVDRDTMLMDTDRIKYHVTPRTRAILPVHLFGQMVDMQTVQEIAYEYGLLMVEDAAQAHGAKWCGTSPGAYSDVACYSHYPTKNLGALGEAGSLTTRLPIVDLRARLLRDAGRTDRYVHMMPGVNSCLDELQAAILRVKLPHLEIANARRRYLAGYYRYLLSGIGDLQFQKIDPRAKPVYHLFVVRTARRAELMDYLREHKIPTLSHYPCPMHHQPFMVTDSLDQGAFPNAEKAAREVMSLPLFPDMTDEELREVCSVVRRFYGETEALPDLPNIRA